MKNAEQEMSSFMHDEFMKDFVKELKEELLEKIRIPGYLRVINKKSIFYDEKAGWQKIQAIEIDDNDQIHFKAKVYGAWIPSFNVELSYEKLESPAEMTGPNITKCKCLDEFQELLCKNNIIEGKFEGHCKLNISNKTAENRL